MINCGHCKNYHPTVADVRACALGEVVGAPQIVRTAEIKELPTRDPDWKRRAPDGVIRTAYDVTEGMWIIPNDPPEIYKVQVAVHGSGNLYAKKLMPPQYKGDKARFEYAKGALRILARHGQPMTLEQAKAYGALYGTCCVCGRTLTRESSIEAGIGPKCAESFVA